MGVVALQAHLLDAAARQGRENGLVLTPLLTQGLLPVQVGLDAIAVADVHGSGAGQATGRALQRPHAPVGRVLHVDIEGGLVKLDDVHPVGLQGQRFLVEQLSKGKGHVHLATVVPVSHGVHNGHGAGQCELEFFAGVGARQLRLEGVHPALQAQRCHHLRYLRVIAAIADAHGHLVLKVDAVHLLQKAMHKVLTGLLAIAHDIQARILLRLDPEQRGIGLGLL